VDLMCEVLEVSRSGYYAWRDLPASSQAQRRDQLVKRIQAVHADNRQIYGSPRIHAELRAQGVVCSENTVARLTVISTLCCSTAHCGRRPRASHSVTTRSYSRLLTAVPWGPR